MYQPCPYISIYTLNTSIIKTQMFHAFVPQKKMHENRSNEKYFCSPVYRCPTGAFRACCRITAKCKDISIRQATCDVSAFSSPVS